MQSDANRKLFRPGSLCLNTYRGHSHPFSQRDSPATITEGTRVNIDNDGVLVFVESRARPLHLLSLMVRFHRSFGASKFPYYFMISNFIYLFFSETNVYFSTSSIIWIFLENISLISFRYHNYRDFIASRIPRGSSR